MSKSGLLSSSIAKKVGMALSGLFLILFLTQHFFINSTSVFSPDTFNSISHFMGNNPLVQFVIQPILIVGVLFHFIMGFILDFKHLNGIQYKIPYQNVIIKPTTLLEIDNLGMIDENGNIGKLIVSFEIKFPFELDENTKNRLYEIL
jgi:hypothetical protein